MIDTVRAYIHLDRRTYPDFKHLMNERVISYSKEGKVISFKHHNLRVSLKLNKKGFPIRLSFYGSISKFYNGNNLTNFEWADVKKAFNKLSKDLGLCLDEAIVTRLDIGYNIEVENPVHEYISCFQHVPRLKVMRYNNESVTFYSKFRAITFYDKLAEIEGKDRTLFKTIPKSELDKNILRYEIRLFKNIAKKLRFKKLYVKDLYRPITRLRLKRHWFNYYHEVIIQTNGLDPTFLLQQRNGASKYLQYHGLMGLGYDRYCRIISHTKFFIKNFASKRSVMKRMASKLLKEIQESSLEVNLIGELDEKIKDIKRFKKVSPIYF